ncbi:pyruvate synthase [Candidatus Woesearchaeota archaeon]|nr:MAG: pyruvate synthase [Candidatus Woesearchaeota archaeon]
MVTENHDKKGWKEIPIGGIIEEAGNAERYKTGTWRSFRPVHHPEKCTNCMICWVNCPDTAIKAGDVNSPDKGLVGKNDDPNLANFGGFDYEHCKGCGICAAVCPTKAIDMHPETEFLDKEGEE